MSTTATSANSADDIQLQMRQVRRELGEGMEEIVENARIMTDWRHYVRTYPWACLGVAAAAGYFLVPTKANIIRPDAATLAEWARSQKLVVQPAGQTRPKSSVLSTLGGMAASALLQGGLAILRNYVSGLAAPSAPRSQASCDVDVR